MNVKKLGQSVSMNYKSNMDAIINHFDRTNISLDTISASQ